MQKPDKQSVKDFIINKTSQELEIPLETVESVVSWSYKKANEATQRVREIELSGIGTLRVSQSKLRNRLHNLYNRLSVYPGDEKLLKELEILKAKISEQDK